ncbi:MAG: hypothetical protein R6U32_06855 [Candidatus Woesearchaeota archaeon]
MELYELVQELEPQLKDIAEEAKREKQKELDREILQERFRQLNKQYECLHERYNELEEKSRNLEKENEDLKSKLSFLETRYATLQRKEGIRHAFSSLKRRIKGYTRELYGRLFTNDDTPASISIPVEVMEKYTGLVKNPLKEIEDLKERLDREAKEEIKMIGILKQGKTPKEIMMEKYIV